MKTTILIILTVLITTLANFFSGLYFTGSSLEKTIEQDLEFAIGIAERLVGTKMTLMKTEAAAVALRLASASSGDRLTELMQEQINEHPDISALSIFDRAGIIASYSVPAHDHDLNLHAKYLDMVYNGATVISSPFFCPIHNAFVMNVYTPAGTNRILAVTMPGQTFSDMLSEQRLWQTGNIFMLNEVGMFIGATNQEIVLAMNNYVLNNADTPNKTSEEISGLVKKILSSDKGVEHYSFDGVDSMCAHSRIDGSALGWRVAVTVPLDKSPRADAMRGQLYAAVFFLLIGIAAAFFLSRVTAQPFKKIEMQNRDLEELNKTIQAQAEAIREEHERVQLMLDATPLACRLWSRNFELLEGNEAAVKLFGLKNKQEYIDRYFDLSPEYQPDGQATRDKIREIVSEAFEKGACTYLWQYRMSDGTPLPCEVTMVRVPYGDDYVVASYSRDLREQTKMLAEIEQRDYLRAIINQAADILLRAEPDAFPVTLRRCMGFMANAINAGFMYIFKNHNENSKLYCSKVCEWSENERVLQSAGLPDNISYSESMPDIRQILERGDCVHNLVRELSTASQKWFGRQEILSVLLVPVFIQEKFWGFVGFGNCHNERLFKENEESIMRFGSLLVVNALLRNEFTLSLRDTSCQLEAALADAKQANNAKRDFLAHMSHEIRTPLNAVIGLSELALDEDNLIPETKSYLEKIYSAGLTILSIVNDILDISKIESGKFDLNPIRYDIPSLINDTETLNITRISEKPITFKVYVDENLPEAFYGDDLRVKQIFNNLLSNAFKYTHTGTVEWRVSFERDGNDVWLVSSVRDTGIGIKPDDMKKLFSAYNQVDTKANRKVEGTGLGLVITKRLVEMMDGTITVKSEYGKGSVFQVRLRQALASGTPIGPQVAQNLMNLRYTLSRRDKNIKLKRSNMSYACVLVVDDIETNLDVAKGMMKPYGIKVYCATSGQQAIDMIRADSPRYSAVFMDHMMPGMDGVETTRIIREEIGTDYARNIPVIALTANAIVGNEAIFLSHGFQDFISKPIDLVKLDVVLRRWVRDKTLEKESPGAEKFSETKTDPPGNGDSIIQSIVIDGLDIQKASERFGGDEAVLIDVLRSYAVNTRPLLASLKEYLDAKNLADYAIVVHGIKGSSYGIFAKAAGEAAEALETASNSDRLDAVKAEHPAFEKILGSLLDNIDQALDAIGNLSEKPAAAEPDPALLAQLREACEAFDMDKVNLVMERLESFRYESGQKLVLWLREQVNNMVFEKIAGGEWPSE